jgi:hypothetical protein
VPADNPRITLANYDRIKFLMPMKDIEKIVGKGERVHWDKVFDAVGATPDSTDAPYKYINGGLWVKWKGKSHALFIQFAGDFLVQNKDDTYSVGPKSQGCLVLFVTEKDRRADSKKNRSMVIDWKYGAYRDTVRRTYYNSLLGSGWSDTSFGVKPGDGIP